MAQIASTLARLHEEGIAHRDIKPTNLYMHEGSWVISDFGLVAIPDGEALTVGARALGPRHFIAPEMLLRPDAADGRPADVYSLGKTLWCLLAGQRIPPPGEHRRDLEWKGLAQWGVSHPRAFYLDRLIEHACAETPGMRPPMSVVSEALANWAHPVRHMSHSKNAVEARDVGAAIGDIFATDQHEAALRRQRETDLEHIVERLAECLTSLSDQLQGSVETRVTRDHNILSNALMGFADALPGKDRIAAWRSIGIYRNTGRDTRQAFLRSGVAAALATDQTVVVAAAHALRHRNGLETIWKDGSPRVLLGSRDLDSEVERIGDGFRRSVPQALARLLEVIRRPPGQLGEEARVSTRGWTT
jgi:serine/threonine protein kinase